MSNAIPASSAHVGDVKVFLEILTAAKLNFYRRREAGGVQLQVWPAEVKKVILSSLTSLSKKKGGGGLQVSS